jgi:chemotaxis protein MotA
MKSERLRNRAPGETKRQNMDISYIFSVVLGFACVIYSISTSGSLSDFWDPPSVFIVLGGVTFATAASYPLEKLKNLMKALSAMMKNKSFNLETDIEKIVEIANTARKNGILALEELTENMDDPFLKKGIMLAVDGSDPELIRNVLETELSVIKERHANNRAILDAAAAYSPAFGMIGTLIGLINMLTTLDNIDSLGPNMSVALVTTFYGTMLANLVFNPLSKRLRAIGINEYLHKELILQGIMAIQNGENPRIIKEKLNAYLSSARQRYLESLSMSKQRAESL